MVESKPPATTTLRELFGEFYPLGEGAAQAAVDYLQDVLGIKDGKITESATYVSMTFGLAAAAMLLKMYSNENFPVSKVLAAARAPGPNS